MSALYLRASAASSIHADVVFAAGRTERKQPLFDALEFGRVEIGGAQCRLKMAARFIQRVQRRIERLDCRLDQAGRLRRPPFQPADHARKRGHAGISAGDHIVSIAQVFRHFLRLHHGSAAFGERGFLACLRRKLVEFVDRVAQPVAFTLGALDFRAMCVGCSLRFAPCFPNASTFAASILKPAKCIKQPAVRAGIDQRALVMLAMDFDQRRCRAA